MLIIPAIDLQKGQAVRLVQGDYDKKTIYSHDPVSLAQDFEAMGAQYLHVVDLDGAKSGSTVNRETICRIRANIGIPMQLGGGVRSAETVSMYLDIGIDRVILGTIAVKKLDFVREMLQIHGSKRIVVGVDIRFRQTLNSGKDEVIPVQARDNKLIGYVSTGGWLEDSQTNYLDFIDSLKSMGAEYLVVTDISRDGTLTAPNWDMYEAISGIKVVVSGGVATEAHIAQAAKYYGVIVGKAHYEGRVDLKQCIRKYSL